MASLRHALGVRRIRQAQARMPHAGFFHGWGTFRARFGKLR
jgi:hypothetical protein